jgi:hypothetical protein
MYGSCVGVLQCKEGLTLGCIKYPMEQKCLHFIPEGEVLLELGECVAVPVRTRAMQGV